MPVRRLCLQRPCAEGAPAPGRKDARLAARKGKGFKVKQAAKVRSVLNEEFHKRRSKGTRRGAFKRDILSAAES